MRSSLQKFTDALCMCLQQLVLHQTKVMIQEFHPCLPSATQVSHRNLSNWVIIFCLPNRLVGNCSRKNSQNPNQESQICSCFIQLDNQLYHNINPRFYLLNPFFQELFDEPWCVAWKAYGEASSGMWYSSPSTHNPIVETEVRVQREGRQA